MALPEPDQLDQVDGTDHGPTTRLRDFRDLESVPPPSYLLKPFVRTEGFGVLYGRPGVGKSLLALDWNCRIATGTEWFDGTRPEQGPVVFIAAEGVAGFLPRAKAWSRANKCELPENFWVWPEAVNFFTGETEAFEAAVAELPNRPVTITVDTLARCMVGGEENSAKDMGLVIENIERLARRFSAAVTVIHHTGKNGQEERGSGALRGASALMIEVRADGSNLDLPRFRRRLSPGVVRLLFKGVEHAEINEAVPGSVQA